MVPSAWPFDWTCPIYNVFCLLQVQSCLPYMKRRRMKTGFFTSLTAVRTLLVIRFRCSPRLVGCPPSFFQSQHTWFYRYHLHYLVLNPMLLLLCLVHKHLCGDNVYSHILYITSKLRFNIKVSCLLLFIIIQWSYRFIASFGWVMVMWSCDFDQSLMQTFLLVAYFDMPQCILMCLMT